MKSYYTLKIGPIYIEPINTKEHFLAVAFCSQKNKQLILMPSTETKTFLS